MIVDGFVPNCVDVFEPQHVAVPSVFIEQECAAPTEVFNGVSVMPTAVGVVELVVVPLPSCPLELSPQHSTVPEVEIAQVLDPPAVTKLAVIPESLTGVVLVVVVPSPNFPDELTPQHHTSSFCFVIHVWAVPTEIERAVESPGTVNGEVFDAVEPLPS